MDENMKAIKALLDAERLVEGSRLAVIKRVFLGNPPKISQTNLPAITIEQVSTPVRYRGNQYMEYENMIEIRLIQTWKDSFKTDEDAEDYETVQISQQQRLIVAGTTNCQVDEDTIVGVLLNNPTLPLEGSDTSEMAFVREINYNANNDRPYKTKEALITVVCKTVADRVS
jgi:hypothetical protein